MEFPSMFDLKISLKSERFLDLLNDVRVCISKSRTQAGCVTEALNSSQILIFEAAYTKVLNLKRSSWLRTTSMTQNELASEYKNRIKLELHQLTKEYISSIDEFLKTSTSKNTANLLKIKADALKYLLIIGEISTENLYQQYLTAFRACESLPALDLLKLKCVHCFVACCGELVSDHKEMLDICTTIFNAAVVELESLPDSDYAETVKALKSISDYINLWTSSE